MHDEQLSRAVQTRMVSLGVSKTYLAKEVGRTYKTLWLWLSMGMTETRHDALMMALDRIEKRKAE